VAAAGCASTFWLFTPGWLSFDSAYQWQQARTGEIDALHPPLQTLLWSWIEPHWSGPASQLLLQQLMLWAGLAGIAAGLRAHWSLRAAWVAAIGLWPPLLLLSAHIWKDIPMMGAFTLAVWMLREELRHPGWRYRGLAAGMLLIACACRHNAITGAAPLLLWIAWRGLADLPRFAARRPLGRMLWALPWALLAGLLLQALAQLPNHLPGVTRPRAVWSVVALWDLAAVSIAEDRVLIPEDFRLPDTRVEDLRAHFSEWSNTTVLESYKLIPAHVMDFSAAQVNTLAYAWLGLPFEHPRAYFGHRLRLTALLLGFDNAALPDALVLLPGLVQRPGNPPIEQPPRRARERLVEWAWRHVDGPLFMGWIYLLLAFATALAAVPGLMRDRPHAVLAGAVAASALTYTLPLSLVSGSAEFRYLAWSLQASLLAPALLCWGAVDASETDPGRAWKRDRREAT